MNKRFGKRYEIEKALGQGAQGEVYAVHDLLLDRRLALKTFSRLAKSEDAWMSAFRREFEVLAGLEHPRLARVHDFGKIGEDYFFTRDYVDGSDLSTAAMGLGPKEILKVMVEVCRALRPMHRAGLVHGDLKPGNIIVDGLGRAHLIDFSFARKVDSADGEPGSGTVQYMAPELFSGKVSDERSDIYSLGATFFELLEGRPMFDGPVGEVVRSHLDRSRPFAKGSKLAGDEELAAGLGKVVAGMVPLSPDERYPDTREVEAALRALLPGEVDDDRVTALPAVVPSQGFGQELSRLERKIEARMETGVDPGLFAVTGDFGTGKGAAVKRFKWLFQLEGKPVVRVSCEGGGSVPVAATLDACSQLGLRGETKDELVSAMGQNLYRSGLVDHGLEKVAAILGEALLDVSEKGALVVLENVDLCSEEALGIFRRMISILRGTKVAVLITCEERFPWGELLGRGSNTLLPGLDKEKVAGIMESYFGTAQDLDVEKVLEKTGGNPLFTQALLESLALDSKGLAGLDDAGAPKPMEDYWQARLKELPESGEEILGAMAVMGRPVTAEEAASVAAVETNVSQAVIALLDEGGWIVRQGARGWEISAGCLQGVKLCEGLVVDPKTLHERAMEQERDEARRMFHAAACGRTDVLAQGGFTVAERLERSGALGECRDLLAQMIHGFDGGQERRRAALFLGRVLLARGEVEGASTVLQEVVDAPEQDLRSDALAVLGKVHLYKRDFEKAKKAFQRALECTSPPERRALVHGELANVLLMEGDPDGAHTAASEGLDLIEDGSSERAQLLGVLGKVASAKGDHEAALARSKEALSAAMSGGDHRTRALAYSRLSWARHQSGDLDGAVEDLLRAISLDREAGDLRRLVRDLQVLGDLRWWQERWSAASEHYEEANRLVGALDNPAQEIEVRVGYGLALNTVGRFESAALVLERSRSMALELGLSELALRAQVYLGDGAAWRDRFPEAFDLWSEARDGFHSLGRHGVCAEVELEMAQLRLSRGGSGDLESAADLVESAANRPREEQGRRFEVMLELVRAQTELARGAFEIGVAAIDSMLEEDCPADLAWQGHLAVAKALVERSSHLLARKRLRSAEEILSGLAKGLPAEHRHAFFQDSRRAQVARLMASVATPSSNALEVSEALGVSMSQLDPEAAALYRVLEFNKRLATETDLDRLMAAILDAAVELTGAERGFVLAPGEDGLWVRAAREMGKGAARDPHQQFSRSIAESVFLDGEAVVTIDAAGDDRFSEFLSIHELKVKSVVCVPISYRGTAHGVVYLENRLRKGRFDARDLRVLSAFADQVAVAISQTELLEEAVRTGKELEETARALEEVVARQAKDLRSRDTDLKMVEERLDRVRRRVEGDGDYHGVIGASSPMRKVFDLMERVKDLDVPVVFVGESGTGKDLLARILHDRGSRSKGPFVPVSCGAMPETLVESTLFGHTKGAFSGADATRPGIFATSAGGTLYLDDIGEMPARMQVDLLRVLQEGCFSPLGSSMSIKTDFRLLASSRVPLKELVERGLLREDLFYRLQVLSVDLPPLRDRKEDIPALARRIIARECNRMNIPERGLSSQVVEALVECRWPGNIRELEQSLRRAVVVAEGGELTVEEVLNRAPETTEAPLPKRGRPVAALGSEEELAILKMLEECQWNRSEAARRLGIPRRTFYRRLKKMGILER